MNPSKENPVLILKKGERPEIPATLELIRKIEKQMRAIDLSANNKAGRTVSTAYHDFFIFFFERKEAAERISLEQAEAVLAVVSGKNRKAVTIVFE